jgi:hypothetical protein
MVKRITLLLAVVAALACAVPALASASSVTSSAGSLAPVGTQLTAKASGFTLKSSLFGPLTCSTLNLNVALTKNDGSSFEASGANKPPVQSGCGFGSNPVTITSFNVTNLSSTTSGSGTASFSIVEDIASLTCTFSGTAVPFTYTAGGSSISFSEGGPLTSSPGSCGTEKISGTFALERSATGTAVILD